MSFGIYMFGCVLVIIGVAWGLIAAGMSYQHAGIASVILLGLGVLTGVMRMRGRDRTKQPGD
jgi:hypothetical protein